LGVRHSRGANPLKKLLIAGAAAAMVALQAPAHAAVITVLAAGVTSIAAPTETFDSVALGAAIGGPGPDGGTYSGNGLIVNGSTSGVNAAPFVGPNPGDRDTTNYLMIGPNHDPETITYATTRDLFGLYWGSVDAYNTVQFYLWKTLVGSFTGSDILPLLANGNQDDFNSNRYVVFTGLSYDQVVLGSSGPCAQNISCNFPNSTAAFELDNVASAVPEPATWLLMLLGFAGIGFVAYRRTRKFSRPISAT
jgi:hypothetical protein